MSRKITVLDGGMGRELEDMGAPFRRPEWSALALMQGPEWVSRVHKNFIKAGAEVLTTNAYAVVPFHIGEQQFFDNGFELAALAGELAQKAAQESESLVKVAGSLPPVFGSYVPEMFDDVLAPSIQKVLVDAQLPYVDFWLAETIGCVAEFRSTVSSVVDTGKKLWAAFTVADELFDGKAKLRSGEEIESVLDLAADTCEAVLFNCSKPEYISVAVQQASLYISDGQLRLGAYANAFAEDASTISANSQTQIRGIRTDLSVEKYVEAASEWIDNGASIVGGCCGIGPAYISGLKEMVEKKIRL